MQRGFRGGYIACMTQITELDPRRHAKFLYWGGHSIAKISEQLDVPRPTVDSWKRRDKWDDTDPHERIILTTEARYNLLIMKSEKTGSDYKEIDLLGRQMERQARITKYSDGGNEADLNPNVKNRNKGDRKKPPRNEFTEEQAEKIHRALLENLFGYQKLWYDAGLEHRLRNILKSRQIGATWYFAREALDDALQTGRNQIFLSASKAQAHVFKEYIKAFAMEAADLELKGDPIVLPNGATLYFLGTNVRTAQSYHGNIYMDEIFWIGKFADFRKVASGMAMHKHWRQTYFSTPSSIQHEAYPFWTGELFAGKNEELILDANDPRLNGGMLCPDGQWRQIVTVMDAVRSGCDLFDIEQLRREYSTDEFNNLLMCMFIDDLLSVFPMSEMQLCMVDSWEVWEDYKPFASRPLGNRPVWIGYDPSNGGDSQALAVIAPPLVPGGKFRVIEKHKFYVSDDYEKQAEFIRQITLRYNVEKITIDATSIGSAVHQLVVKFFPAAQGLTYSQELKALMVLKAKQVVSKRRLEFDAGDKDIVSAFISIKKTLTESGRSMTYKSDRSKKTSHADIAWAIINAIYNEPLTASADKQSIVEIYS